MAKQVTISIFALLTNPAVTLKGEKGEKGERGDLAQLGTPGKSALQCIDHLTLS